MISQFKTCRVFDNNITFCFKTIYYIPDEQVQEVLGSLYFFGILLCDEPENDIFISDLRKFMKASNVNILFLYAHWTSTFEINLMIKVCPWLFFHLKVTSIHHFEAKCKISLSKCT